MIDANQIIGKVESVPEVPVATVLSSENIRVLFAEDSTPVVNIFQTVVQRLGWNGIYVENALQMIDAVNHILNEGLTLDAVVADINFVSGPKLTGITAVREIRKALPNVPVIFISAYVTSIIREEVRRVNAEIMQKPFDIENLFVRLSQSIYWNRLVTSTEYVGEDRRRNSVNRSPHFRRATDYILSTPERIAASLKGISTRDKQ